MLLIALFIGFLGDTGVTKEHLAGIEQLITFLFPVFMNKIIGPILLFFLNLSVSISQHMEGLWMIANISVKNEEGIPSSGYGLIEFVNDSVFRFPSNDSNWTGYYKLQGEKLELSISRKYKASGYVRDSLLYLDVFPNYGIYRKWNGKFIIKSVAKKLRKQESIEIELGDHLRDGIWRIKSGQSFSYIDTFWQFLDESTAVVDYGHSANFSPYHIFIIFDQVFIELNHNGYCHLISAMDGEIIAECFYMDYMEYEAESRENIPFSQIITFKKEEYPSLDEFDQMKKKIIGEWEGVFVYPEMTYDNSDSTIIWYDFWALGDSIIGDTVILKFHENQVFEAVQNGQYFKNDSLVSEQKIFTGEWELDKSLGFVIINEIEYKHNTEYIKIISLDEENGCMSSSVYGGLFGINILSHHKMIKKK